MRSRCALLLALCATGLVVAAVSSGAVAAGPTAPPDADADAAPAPLAAETTTATHTPTSAPAQTVAYGLVALYEDDGELVREVAIAPDDVASVGTVEPSRTGTGGYFLEVTLTDGGAENFTETALAAGFGDGGACRYGGRPEDPGECLLTVVDGEVIYSVGIEPELGRTIESGEFAENPTFVLNSENESQAERLRAVLSGEAPTTATGTPGDATTATPTTESDDGTGGSIPGFGAPAAVVAAALALGVFGTRRRGR